MLNRITMPIMPNREIAHQRVTLLYHLSPRPSPKSIFLKLKVRSSEIFSGGGDAVTRADTTHTTMHTPQTMSPCITNGSIQPGIISIASKIFILEANTKATTVANKASKPLTRRQSEPSRNVAENGGAKKMYNI